MRINKREKKVGALGVFCLLLAACGGGGGEEDDGPPIPITRTSYQVVFSADQVVGGTPAADTVTATATLSSASGEDITASGNVSVSGTTATAVTINAGYAGENGPVAVTLTDAGGGSWNVPAGTELDQEDLFRLDATGYYVTIQSPDGELRGQILPPDWTVGMVPLDAASVVPASNSTAAATAGITINARTGEYRTRVTVNGASDVIGTNIRNAIAGALGDVAIALEASMTNPNVWGSRDINNVNAADRFTTTGLDQLASGELYFSVESAARPGGELRGQIVDETITIVDEELTAAEVVTSGPPVVSTASGVATITWVEALSRFAVAVNTDIANAVSVFVHQGAPGENGAFLFTLTPDVSLPGNWVLPITELDSAQTSALVSGNLYVSIVTATYPEGELRGQIDL